MQQFGVASLKGCCLSGAGRDGMAPVQVFSQQECIYAGSVAPERAVLEGKREHLGLQEPGIPKNVEYRSSFKHIVQIVAEEQFRVAEKLPGYIVAIQVNAIRRRNTEMTGHLLQPVAHQAALGKVIVLNKEISVDDVAAVNIPARVIDRALGQI